MKIKESIQLGNSLRSEEPTGYHTNLLIEISIECVINMLTESYFTERKLISHKVCAGNIQHIVKMSMSLMALYLAVAHG